jgi:hypothetical protein
LASSKQVQVAATPDALIQEHRLIQEHGMQDALWRMKVKGGKSTWKSRNGVGAVPAGMLGCRVDRQPKLNQRVDWTEELRKAAYQPVRGKRGAGRCASFFFFFFRFHVEGCCMPPSSMGIS